MRWFKMRVCKVSVPVRDGVGWRRDLPLEGSGAGLPAGTHVPLGWALRFLGACLCKWFRHVKFQFKYFFNSLSWSAPYLFIWGQTQLPGAMTCATSNSLQIPGSPIFEELTHFFFFLKFLLKKVNGWPCLLKRYLRTNLYTCPFIWHLWRLERTPDNTA